MATALWWIGNAVLAFVALPVLLVRAVRIIRSLAVVNGAVVGIAASSETIASTVPPVIASVGRIADRCRDLRDATTSPVGVRAGTAG